jgi:hypothetical protein
MFFFKNSINEQIIRMKGYILNVSWGAASIVCQF